MFHEPGPPFSVLSGVGHLSDEQYRPGLIVPQHRQEVPTFGEFVPVVSAAVSAGTRRAYGSYWNRVTGRWGCRRLDEPPRPNEQLRKTMLTPPPWDQG